MGKLWEILQHPDEIYPLLKLKMVAHEAQNQVPPEPHWGFCYSMIPKLSRTYALLIHSLGTEKHSQLRNAICVFYLVLRALDTVEDDTSLATDVKLPILRAFHQHISDRDWHFSCGTDHCKVLMDEFRHVTTAFLELERSCQLVIEDMIMRAGSGMATFIDKEIATAGDYDDYCRAVAGPIALGLSKFFHYPGLQDLAPEEVTDSMALLFQKANIVHDYLEDINEVPKPRKFWPREIWSKYSNQLEDLKDEENSEKAVQCLNEMVTDALLHVEDCLKCVSIVKDPDIFRFSAIPLIMSVGILALCYNNTRYFKERVKVRRGLAAVIFYQTNTMSDVYGALYDFACMMKLKVNKNDPNATKTLSRIEAIQKICRDSGTLNTRKLHIERTKSSYALIMMMLFLTILAICFARLSCSPTK